MKIPDCNRCLLYGHNPHLICAVHPDGVSTDRCLDFRADPKLAEAELWSPEGYSFYDGELIRFKPSRYTKEEKLEILDTHPIFTGVCPECKYRFDLKSPPLVHWDCPRCGWIDDSV